MRFTSRSALTCKVLKMIGESQRSPREKYAGHKVPICPLDLSLSFPFSCVPLLIPPSSFSHLQVPGREDGQDATNLGFFPRLGFRADSTSRQCGHALSPPRREEASVPWFEPW